MPPLLIMMALTLPIYMIVEPDAVNWPQIFFAITYLSNLYTVAGLFLPLKEAMHEYGPLWSLAVEEHFYLLFPFVLLISKSWKTRVGILIGVVVFSLVLRIVAFATLADPENFNYYFTLTRLDSIAWGCLLTFALAKPELAERLSRYRGWKSFVFALALLLGEIAFRNDFFQDTFRYTIHGIGMALLLNVFVFGRATEPLLAIAEWKPVQIGGRISYELYLWHQHVIFVMSLFVARYWVKMPLSLLITVVISYLAYRFSSALTKGLAKRYGSRSVEEERKHAYDKAPA
jgi:peptidoglycan/LPS O-acetylase OafA/YrhL